MTHPDEAGTTLLLVEDNPDYAQFVERLLTESRADVAGREADPAFSIDDVRRTDRLADALDRVRDGSPDVVLLDLMLPDSEGVETVETVVERAPAVPVVVLTGRDEDDLGVEAIQRGAAEYLAKGSLTAEGLRRALRYAVERQRNLDALRDRNHRLALLNRIVGQAIRNDVSMIVGRGDQLRGRVDPADEPALEALLDAARHVVDLTDTAAALIDALSADELHREPRDLEAVLDAAISRLSDERDASVTVQWNVPDDEPLTVYGSPMLESAFEHLLFNAVDHAGQDSPRVDVTVETTSDRASVRIADHGVGIPDEQKALLVDPEAGFGDGSGIGVGLYLVTTILREVGGDFDIADNDPQGTIVTVTLDRL